VIVTGFNSHLRNFGRPSSSSTATTPTHRNSTTAAASTSASSYSSSTSGVPFLRVLYEREVGAAAVRNVPHFKSIDIALQPCCVRADVDFALYLLALATKTLPEFADSAVLDKMSR
jgi:hypothetical protein